jgi:hypothetical protein
MSIPLAGKGKWICDARHIDGFSCTRERAHKGEHAAHDLEGTVVKAWRGGRMSPALT